MSFLRYAVMASAILLGCQPALALPQANEVNPLPASAWVLVNEGGAAVTMSPVVSTKGGVATTINAPPSALTATGTYTLLPSGLATTKTGLAPVATATGKNDAGIFLACTRYKGPGGAICQPEEGTVLYVGETYYVTWNPAYFPDGNTKVAMQAVYENGTGEVSGPLESASKGFWAWEIEDDFLKAAGRTSMSVVLSLQQDDTSTTNVTNDVHLVPGGPTVYVTYPPPLVPAKGNGPSVIAIAVPVVVAVVVLLLAGLCFWSWRRHGTVPLVGALGKVSRRSSSGYGVRKSASERVGRGAAGIGGGAFGASGDKTRPNINIQLTDRDSWSPTGTGNTRNVFREEMQRQERQR